MSNLNQQSEKNAQRQQNNGAKGPMEKVKKRDSDGKKHPGSHSHQNEAPIIAY